MWHIKAESRRLKLAALALMYWGAALMLLVDSFFSKANGGKFFNLSVSDALLGAVVILCGLVAWAFMLIFDGQRNILHRKD